jgi:hypothetical protein
MIKRRSEMKRVALVALVAAGLGLPLTALAESWKDVAVVDTNCIGKVKANPDAHTTKCALQCQKGGYGLITADGTYLKFDAAGNEKAVAALKATKKEDHLRATVTGERDGETVKVTAIAID